MRTIFTSKTPLALVITALLLTSSVVSAQSLRAQLESIFTTIVDSTVLQTVGSGHNRHFNPATVTSSGNTINAFSNFISSNISSFPLSSTSAGLTFDFSSGQPVSTATSLGPIFSERAQTLGKGRFNFGLNFSSLNFARVRGTNLEDLRFSFLHQDVGVAGLGDSPNELDYMDLFMDMELSANIFAFIGTIGITDNFDIGVAVPFINLSMRVNATGRMNSFTALVDDEGDGPNHRWEETGLVISDRLPSFDESTAGFGDMAFRLKYNFVKDQTLNVAALGEYRAATGDSADFLGSGSDVFRTALIFSGAIGDFSPHLNVAYELRTSDLDRNELEIFAGFDQKVTETFTIAVDLMAELEIGDQIEELVFDDPVTISRQQNGVDYSQTVEFTNIPNFDSDHQINTSIGIKFNPKEGLMMIGNTIFAVNEGGLRADVIPTFGLEFSF